MRILFPVFCLILIGIPSSAKSRISEDNHAAKLHRCKMSQQAFSKMLTKQSLEEFGKRGCGSAGSIVGDVPSSNIIVLTSESQKSIAMTIEDETGSVEEISREHGKLKDSAGE